MAKPYQREMAKLAETLEWALNVDASKLESAVRVAKRGPLVAIGSGGSLSTANALAYYHRLITGHISTVLTPLESIATRLDPDAAIWLITASGNNVDIVGAAKTLVEREPRQLAAFLGRDKSKLGEIAQSHPYMDLLPYPPPTGKDGFLATNSLFGAAIILARAYDTQAQGFVEDEGSFGQTHALWEASDSSSARVQQWRDACRALWERDTTVVLHGASGALGAIDLESKFTEAAVGHAQIADYRNFAHGRHHWLAKRGENSAVLALIGEDDQDVSERTLALLPSNIPVVRIPLEGPPIQASLLSLIAAFRLTEWAGQSRGIDPGDPGVPEFGRRIYHLEPKRAHGESLPPGITRRAAAAIERKAGRTVPQLHNSGELKGWSVSLHAFQRRLSTEDLVGVVLDYDGTVVDTRQRFDPPSVEMTAELTRLLDAGISVGIATGRGRSAREELQAAISPILWPRVVIGYYNGSEVSTLDDVDIPSNDQTPVPELRAFADLLESQPELAAQANLECRANQITVTPRGTLGENRLWAIIQSVIQDSGQKLTALRSSHSVDVLNSAASKLRVIETLRERAGDGLVLAIGDRGRWPGNDHELLSSLAGLSVDQCSPSSESCWNLGAPGQRGPAVTLEYLRAIEVNEQGQARLNVRALE